MNVQVLRQRWLMVALILLLVPSGCGKVTSDPVPDLEPPVPTCSGDDCSCPLGTHLVPDDTTRCEYCPFGSVNADPHATSCGRSQIVAGDEHTCALLPDGRVRCWGVGLWGRLGYGNVEAIGDDEPALDGGNVQLGAPALQLAAGSSHTCVLLEGGDVRCWGYGSGGRLGLGDEESIGDDELPTDRPVVDLGEPALQLAAGGAHSCALLEGGRIRCWGQNDYGQLGNGDTGGIGDDEPPRLGLDVDLGAAATEVVLGGSNGCAVLETGSVRCWGIMDFRYLSPEELEVTRSPADAGDLPLPGPVKRISLGSNYACALLSGGALRCWGQQTWGELGHHPDNVLVELEDAEDVPTGGQAVRVQASSIHTCAIFSEGNARCWGGALLGYPGTGGPYMTPLELGDIDVGGVVTDLATGRGHTCVLLNSGAVRCWGEGSFEEVDGARKGGWLGYGNTDDIGDDETPAAAGDVPYL